jgi:hypothetical protein
MDQFVAHAGHLTPGILRVVLPDLAGDTFGRLADHFQRPGDGINSLVVLEELLI